MALFLDSELLQGRLCPSLFSEHEPDSAVSAKPLGKFLAHHPMSWVGMWYAGRAPGWGPGALDFGLRSGPNILGQLGKSYPTRNLSQVKFRDLQTLTE